jgi:hypothetical protein
MRDLLQNGSGVLSKVGSRPSGLSGPRHVSVFLDRGRRTDLKRSSLRRRFDTAWRPVWFSGRTAADTHYSHKQAGRRAAAFDGGMPRCDNGQRRGNLGQTTPVTTKGNTPLTDASGLPPLPRPRRAKRPETPEKTWKNPPPRWHCLARFIMVTGAAAHESACYSHWRGRNRSKHRAGRPAQGRTVALQSAGSGQVVPRVKRRQGLPLGWTLWCQTTGRPARFAGRHW